MSGMHSSLEIGYAGWRRRAYDSPLRIEDIGLDNDSLIICRQKCGCVLGARIAAKCRSRLMDVGKETTFARRDAT